MGFSRDKLAFFASMPLDAQDWRNLNNSGLRYTLVPWGIATPSLLTHLSDAHQTLVVRMSGDESISPPSARLQLEEMKRHADVGYAILPRNEADVKPDGTPYDWTYGSANWGNKQDEFYPLGAAQTQNMKQFDMWRALNDLVPTVSAATSARRRAWEVPPPGGHTSPPLPGRVTWRELTAPSANLCRYNGFHLYADDFAYQADGRNVDWERWVIEVEVAQELYHKPLFIDEVGIFTARLSPVEKMRAYLHLATVLLSDPLGDRVEMLTPFVANGNGQGWSLNYLLRDPACWRLVRDFIGGANF